MSDTRGLEALIRRDRAVVLSALVLVTALAWVYLVRLAGGMGGMGDMAGTMSGGEQRMLEIGRALMWEPKLILMDEPSAGLAPLITKAIFEQIQRLNRELGLTILMIEQNARRGLEASDRGYVLELGRNSYQGAGQELLHNDEVRRAFLGG